ncbi:MAG TPA: VTT domain-containing protein [Acidobacteriaceae bacterium]|nr:VTT domain-containing protein [Acidobacteriaceae bacterium]
MAPCVLNKVLLAFQASGQTAPPQNSYLFRWLMGFGGLGLFLIAAVDSSILPFRLPGSTDLLLLLLIAHRGDAPLMALSAIAGSVAGAYTCWKAGAKGREVAIDRYLPRKYAKQITEWGRSHGGVAAVIAALLPPPVPMLPFLLAAGAVGVSRRRFLLCFGAGRAIRYSMLAWLGATYGRKMARLWSHYVANWIRPFDWLLAGLLAASVLYAVWKWRRIERQIALSSSGSLENPG